MRKIWQKKILARPGDQVLDVVPKKIVEIESDSFLDQ